MSELNSTDEEKSPSIRTTFRLSQEQNMFLEELIEDMNLSKQKVMSILFDKGMSIVKEEIKNGVCYKARKKQHNFNGLPHSCPRCGLKAHSNNEVEQLFGLRTIESGVRFQSWCRKCRGKI